MSKAYKYSGILGKRRQFSLVDREPSEHKVIGDAFRALYDAETELLLVALSDDCGLSAYQRLRLERGLGSVPSGWQKVALTLAQRHVPAFFPPKLKRRAGPRSTRLSTCG